MSEDDWAPTWQGRLAKRLHRHLSAVRRELAQPLRRPLGPRWWRHPLATLGQQHIVVEIVGTAIWVGLVISAVNQVPHLPLARHDGFVRGLPGTVAWALFFFTFFVWQQRWTDRPGQSDQVVYLPTELPVAAPADADAGDGRQAPGVDRDGPADRPS